MSREKQIEEMAKIIAKNVYATDEPNIDFMPNAKNAAKELFNNYYRKQSEVIDEFAKRLKDYPINVRLPLLGLETKEEIEAYVNNLFDQIESIVEKIAEEMKGGE